MTYEEAKAIIKELEAAAAKAGAPLSAYPKGPMGLTPDHIKASPQWRAERLAYQTAAAKLRAANSWIVKTFPKEHRAERRAITAERTARFEAKATL